MRAAQRKNLEPGQAAGLLKLRAAVALMPDRDRRCGHDFRLEREDRFNPYGALMALVCGGTIALAAYLLKLAWFAAHIPFPGR